MYTLTHVSLCTCVYYIYAFVCIGVLLGCMSVHHTCVVPVEVKENVRFPRTRVTGGCEPSLQPYTLYICMNIHLYGERDITVYHECLSLLIQI